jgi:hypothetical protein
MTPSTDDPEGLGLASRNTEEMVTELLRLCLERIGYQGEVSEWQARLDQAIDRIQARLHVETEPLPLRITAFQMDCLGALCRAAVTGREEDIRLGASRLREAFVLFEKGNQSN